MAYDISSSINIAAPPEKVWAVLADLANYAQWHPAYQAVTGELTVGSTLTIKTTSPATGNPITLKVKVLTVQPGSELAWASRLLGVTTIRRRFLLRPSDGGTELTQAGTYRGMGGSRGPGGARGALKTVANIRGSYEAINEAVKKQAEGESQP
ncbi:MAG TPA: SRPBCC domain-containing protein [Streptosporangiaceae bacterium]|nr:SRPBCC domain-containing protein [Streptosporangiaceae bacterium]